MRQFQPRRLKYVTKFAYGDSIAADEHGTGNVPVFGSNGCFSYCDRANTLAPAIIVGRKGSFGKINWTPSESFATDTTYFIDSSTTYADLRWLYYYLQTLGLDSETDDAAVPGLNRELAYSKRVLLPPFPVQELIAKFLDRETSQIDRLIAAKERLLTLLTERCRALITHAVTGELLTANDSKMRQMRLKHCIIGIEQGFSPQCMGYPAEPGAWGVLKTGCVNGGRFDEHQNKALPDEIDAEKKYAVKVGDILMSRASGSVHLIGSVAQVQTEPKARLLLSDKTFRIAVDEDVVTKDYFVLLMGSTVVRSQIQLAISGASGLANNLPSGEIREFVLPIPSIQEQKAAVGTIKMQLLRFDELEKRTRATLNLSHERRSALIAAAVTGQIELELK